MSLKAFHVLFITASILLALGVGGYWLREWAGHEGVGYLVAGLGAVAVGLALIGYEAWFIRKARRLP